MQSFFGWLSKLSGSISSMPMKRARATISILVRLMRDIVERDVRVRADDVVLVLGCP